MRTTSRLVTAALTALLACAAAAAPAHGHDSLAPPGANHAWLPEQDAWVMQHWMPFDESRLYAALGIDNFGLERWLRDDHHTIAELARRRRGIGPEELADKLVAPWHGKVVAAHEAELRQRTMRMLTQGHLAQHVLFHYFHGTLALDRTQSIFGVDRRTFQHLRGKAWTPFAIGRRGGRSEKQVTRGMLDVLHDASGLGERSLSHTPAQARYMLRRRTKLLPCFLRRSLPKFDPGNPYGDPNGGHGDHTRDSLIGLLPGTKQLTARDGETSCWHEPKLRVTAPVCRLIPRDYSGVKPSANGA